MERNTNMSDPHQRRERGPQFWRITSVTCRLAATVDVTFFFIFYFLGSPILAWINVISVAMYVLAYHALKRRQNRLAVRLIWVEVVAHSALGTLIIGWESGFHYYLMMFIPVLFMTMPLKSAVFSLFGLWMYYIGLDVLMWYVSPVQPIPSDALLGVQLFNLSVVFGMFGYLAFFYQRMVLTSQRKLRRLATVDSLTGLFNRRHGSYLAEKEISRFARSGQAVAFMLLDVDHFKMINDRYGHEMGDRILEEVGRLVPAQLRTQDLVARWGGEEFLIILPGTGMDSATASAERVRAAIGNYDWGAATGISIEVTVSVGVSELCENDNMASVVSRADQALYRGKASGRNRVEQGMVCA